MTLPRVLWPEKQVSKGTLQEIRGLGSNQGSKSLVSMRGGWKPFHAILDLSKTRHQDRIRYARDLLHETVLKSRGKEQEVRGMSRVGCSTHTCKGRERSKQV